MSYKFIVGALLVGFVLTSQSDAQIFRRRGTSSADQAQQQKRNRKQQESKRQQTPAGRQSQPRVAVTPQSRAKLAYQLNLQQIQKAKLELVRQQQTLAQLQAALNLQEQLAKGGRLRRRSDNRITLKRQLERQKQVVSNATKLLASSNVNPNVRTPTNVPTTYVPQKVVPQPAIKRPTLAGPSESVSPAVRKPSAINSPGAVTLNGTALTPPASILKKDPAVVPASGTTIEIGTQTNSVLEARPQISILKSSENPAASQKSKVDRANR